MSLINKVLYNEKEGGVLMSYDLYLTEPMTGEVIELEENHRIEGGTYAAGGTRELWLNITYNYGKHFYRIFGEKGIRTIYGMTGADSIPVIEKAIAQLDDDVVDDYWEATEGNAKKSLYGLLAFVKLRPDGLWQGD